MTENLFNKWLAAQPLITFDMRDWLDRQIEERRAYDEFSYNQTLTRGGKR